jgi:hypothetical protein
MKSIAPQKFLPKSRAHIRQASKATKQPALFYIVPLGERFQPRLASATTDMKPPNITEWQWNVC